MGNPAVPEAPRHPGALRELPQRRWVFAALLLAVTPLFLAFAWQSPIASVSDDSVSYLAIARFFALGEARWVPYVTNFPPLFPLLIAAVGGASDFARAHLLVAACAVLALPLIYRFAALQFGRRDAALLVTVLFLLSPTAWISVKGILSEPLFLLATMAALVFFETRMTANRRALDGWLFGLLLAAAVTTRALGALLVAAYAVHVAVRCLALRRAPSAQEFIPLVPPLLFAAAWVALRPSIGADAYGTAAQGLLQGWIHDPAAIIGPAAQALLGGWIASFTGDADVSGIQATILALLGLLSVAGTIIRIRDNRLDGWYVALTLCAVLAWFFGEENTRRLLYPVVPLLLVHAGVALLAIARRLHVRRTAVAVLIAALVPVLVCLPALWLIVQKALDRRPVLEGFAIRYSDMTDYYTTINLQRARALAAKHAAVLAGFEAIAQATPPGAKVMWMRPEYVSILGRRAAEPWFYDWDERTLARKIGEGGVDYVVVASLFKADLAGRKGDQAGIVKGLSRMARPAVMIPNEVVGGNEFILMQVDRNALAAVLAQDGRADHSLAAPNTSTRRAP